MPKGISTIKEFTFENSGIEKINIPKSVESIGIRAFSNTAIKTVTLPKTVKKLGENVFYGCKKLENVTMPGNVGVIKIVRDYDYAPSSFFWGTSKPLKKVKFITELNLDIVSRIAQSESFEVASNDSKYRSVDGLIYTKDGKKLVRIPLGRKKTIISDKCTNVSAESYGYKIYGVYSLLREIVFSKTVTKITDGEALYLDISHYECNDIKVNLCMDYLDNESIQRLWLSNIYWRNSLKDELLRKGFAKLNEENERMLMLEDGYLCSYLTKENFDIEDYEAWELIDGLVIPDNVKTIGEEAFRGYFIRSIILGSGVEYIENDVFWAESCTEPYKDSATIYIKRPDIVISDDAFERDDYIKIVMI